MILVCPTWKIRDVFDIKVNASVMKPPYPIQTSRPTPQFNLTPNLIFERDKSPLTINQLENRSTGFWIVNPPRLDLLALNLF